MAGLKQGTSPNVVKTALDGLFMAKFSEMPGPQIATADSPEVFNQESTDRAAVILETFKGPGLWTARAEDANVNADTALAGDQKTYTVSNYANSVDISKRFFDDDQHMAVKKMMEKMGNGARITKNRNAMAIFRNATTTTLTGDGAALGSNTHTNLNGDTVDNLLSTAFGEAALETAIVALLEQLNQEGLVSGHEAGCLLVPPALYKDAVEVTESELRSGTAHNDVNVYSSKYGIVVKQSHHLGTADGGSDTFWALLGKDHSINRFKRQDIDTNLVSHEYQRNNNYIYKGEFREVYGVQSYEGVIIGNS